MPLESEHIHDDKIDEAVDPPHSLTPALITRRGLMRLGLLAGLAYVSPFESPNTPSPPPPKSPPASSPPSEVKSIIAALGMNILNDPETLLRPIKNPHPFTNTPHRLGTSTYRNLGVDHTPEAFEQNKYNILTAMRETDIVCLEWEPLQTPIQEQYFRPLYCLAEGNGKTPLWIDHHKNGVLYAQHIAHLSSSLLSLLNVFLHRDLHKPQESYVWWERTGLSFLIGTARPIPRSTHLTLSLSMDTYNPIDMSYTTDGRTVQMLANIQKIARDTPHKRLLSITGYVHACGIDFYLRHPRWFAVKKALYQKLYGLDFPP